MSAAAATAGSAWSVFFSSGLTEGAFSQEQSGVDSSLSSEGVESRLTPAVR